jgi:hypothetical protein
VCLGRADLARLYNKSTERRALHDEGYFALLAARDPAAFDPNRDVWRLEFQIRREGLTIFHLAPSAAGEVEDEDLEAQIEAELSRGGAAPGDIPQAL